MQLGPEPEHIGTFRTHKTASRFIGPIQVKETGGCRIHLCPGLNETVIFTDRTDKFPVPDHHGIGFSFTVAGHGSL
jgi:hypothetical protein